MVAGSYSTMTMTTEKNRCLSLFEILLITGIYNSKMAKPIDDNDN